MPLAITTYLAVKALHVMAAFAAYGLPFAYPFMLPYLRRRHPRALPGVHDVQHKLNKTLTGPGTVLLLAFGLYLAGRDHVWHETWVQIPMGILAAIVVLGGYVVHLTGRLADLARGDVAAAEPGGAVAFGAEYERTWRRYLAIESLLGLLVLVAIFVMVTKP